MSIPFSNTHYRIPQGFGNLLEGLTREILKEQPDNIPAFAAAYFENLLEKREKTDFDPAEWGAKVEDRFYNNRAFQEHECEKSELEEKSPSATEEETPVMSLKFLTDYVTTRQWEGFRANKRKIIRETQDSEENKDKETAAVKIQAAFRGHMAREDVKKIRTSKAEEETEGDN